MQYVLKLLLLRFLYQQNLNYLRNYVHFGAEMPVAQFYFSFQHCLLMFINVTNPNYNHIHNIFINCVYFNIYIIILINNYYFYLLNSNIWIKI